MSTGNGAAPEPGQAAGIEELKADAEMTRHQLAETVGALSDKLDVKSRIEQKAADTKTVVQTRSH